MATTQLRPAVFTNVDQLKPTTRGHNLVLKVQNSKVVVEKTRADGTKVSVAEAVVGDQTGIITLTARNEQINLVVPGNTIVVRNAKIIMFKGFMRLEVDKWGKIENAAEPATFDINESHNMSSVEYELVQDPNAEQ
eukprot:TRINITY_DN12232_c0_g1_i1.p2 TRINITY_DN12232_c0_g1~~TRINITY_DN12232_c0_g1_i1.p2  ORF type:complete len:143 (+),score=24.49 TRINITY_DN12232_c0_g1_i1:24-431(+)